MMNTNELIVRPLCSNGERARSVAIALGIRKILITCDDDTSASQKIIERNGGQFENVVLDVRTEKRKRRY